MLAKEIRPDRVAIYIRWSTEDQGDGTTLVVQQEGCQHYVLSQGWRVTPSLIYIDDGYSGGTLDRPKMTELRQAVTAGEIDCVVVYKLDRLSRSVMDTVNLVLGEWDGRTFLKSAREPIDTSSAMGKQFFYMLVSYAEWERSVIKERTFSGKLRRAKEGKNPGGPVPIGYRLSGEKGILEVDPEKAEIVKRIFRRYLEEVGTYRIAEELNRDGIPSPTGLKWNTSTLLKILKNPIYAGTLKYGKVTTNHRRQRDKSEPWFLKNPDPITADSRCPAIISQEEFDRVHALINQRNPSKIGVRALSSEYLLTGLLKCRCGAPMVSHSSQKHGNGKLYAYYGCNEKKIRGTSACSCGLIPQDYLDQAVEAAVKKLLSSNEALAEFYALRFRSLEEHLKQTQVEREQCETALRSLSDQAKRLNQDYRSGRLSATLYEENRREIDKDTVPARARLQECERLERSLATQLKERDAMNEIFDLARRWDQIDVTQRKIVLRHLMDEVRAFKRAQTSDIEVTVAWKVPRSRGL